MKVCILSEEAKPTWTAIHPFVTPTTLQLWPLGLVTSLAFKDRHRFFDRAGHETLSAFSGNKHFFMK